MLFHVTMTHTPEDCVGYNLAQMPEAIAALDNLTALAEDLNIKCHFWVQGAPEHVAYTLIEADNPGAVTRFVHSAIPYRQDFKVTLVQHAHELVTFAKMMMEQA